jgi:hypothetical protein
MEKRGDLFVGVTDLFSILLPGAMATFLVMKAEQSAGWDLFDLIKLRDVPGYTAFLVCAYLFGNLLDIFGAVTLDRLYDLSYADQQRYRGPFFRWLLVRLPRRLWFRTVTWFACLFSDRPDKPDDKDDQVVDALLEAAEAKATQKPSGDRLYQWCRDWLQIKNAAALTEVERLQASSKFFRGVVITTVLLAVLLWLFPEFPSKGARQAQHIWLWIGGCVSLAAFAFVRFCDLRWKAVHHAYRLYVIGMGAEDDMRRAHGAAGGGS